MSDLALLFTNVRAEYYCEGVYDQFVLPPYYSRLNVGNDHRPLIVVGGRGSGKTMLLRYLSYETTFYSDRVDITDAHLSHIGLYWKPDPNFLSVLQGSDASDQEWEKAFRHLAVLLITRELLKSLLYLANHPNISVTFNQLATLTLPQWTITQIHDVSLEVLTHHINTELIALDLWVNNMQNASRPTFLSFSYLDACVSNIKEQILQLNRTCFNVYIDEFENLTDQQQALINTRLKSSAPPLVFNYAIRRTDTPEKRTLTGEQIMSAHDYRVMPIDNLPSDSFDVFAGEILLNELAIHKDIHYTPESLDPKQLRDAQYIEHRSTDVYGKGVRKEIGTLLPSVTHCDLAAAVFRNTALKNILISRIEEALRKRKSQYSSDDFLSEEYPDASVVCMALLNRKLDLSLVKAEFEKHKLGESSRFTKGQWIHNNLLGCLLQLYEPNARICPAYTGFETFCRMAHGNIRFLIVLCSMTIEEYLRSASSSSKLTFPGKAQALAAHEASELFLREILSSGKYGRNLYAFTLRLGSLFRLSQRRKSQSEPEVTHFTITKGDEFDIPPQLALMLGEATAWSVLFRIRETKNKSDDYFFGDSFLLNPMYAPYFHISWRNKRKLELSMKDIYTIMLGSAEEYMAIENRFAKKWSIPDVSSTDNLFRPRLLED